MKRVKSLYKLARNKLFWTKYYCMYCCMLDSDKKWMKKHIHNLHDECGKSIKIFSCEKCKFLKFNILEHEIMQHIAKHH